VIDTSAARFQQSGWLANSCAISLIPEKLTKNDQEVKAASNRNTHHDGTTVIEGSVAA